MYPSDVTYSQIAHAAQKAFNKGGKIIFLNEKPDIPDNVFAKDLSIYDEANYYPRISVEAGLVRIREYRKRN